MVFIEFCIGDDDVDRRLDRVIRKFLSEVPLSVLFKNIRSGFIRVNNRKVKNDYRMNKGDTVFVEKKFFETNAKTQKNVQVDENAIYFDTVFENEHIQVINKPYGVSVQGASNNDISLDRIIKVQYEKKQSEGIHPKSLSFSPGPLHRLDKNTTGLLAFSQSLQGARYFSAALANHNIKKEYIALLSGTIQKECVWEHSIQKNDVSNTSEFATVSVYPVMDRSDTAKYAKTIVIPIATGNYLNEPITIVRILIETGRTHQIRSQASYCGHVLIGDTAYGYKGVLDRYFLHAYLLEFPHDNPIGLPKSLAAEMPFSFKKFMNSHLPNVSFSAYNDS